MTSFIPGQRWVNDAELQMGLGTVLSSDQRTVTIVFPATEETRIYSKQTAPLTRIKYVPGDIAQSNDGSSVKVQSVREEDGLLVYSGNNEKGVYVELLETQLDNFIQLNRPIERLFNGQIDHNKWFELRYNTLQHLNRLTHSPLRGLSGCRTSLIAHQIYIAHEVSNRYAPRVLLADEVGLGKTIEAGLILHQQLLTERSRRALILVPETLIHQWLVEMLRRFNLHFSIFDAERYDSIVDENQNPFLMEQLVLCSLDFLKSDTNAFNQILKGEWDLLIVDEAHHLEWSEEKVSQEYKVVEQLANNVKGILLLTATPEQLGKDAHFARLRLLDPDRFSNLDLFLQEEKSYESIADIIQALIESECLDEKITALIKKVAKKENNSYLLSIIEKPDNEQTREELLEYLLDCHGTGRILFRNTREIIKGFPERQIHPAPLPLPEQYALMKSRNSFNAQDHISIETAYQAENKKSSWTSFDPRISWLTKKLSELNPEKVLIIAAKKVTALQLSEKLRTYGLYAAVFHEDMSILERDRAAAYFADSEKGSQVLICSEIGSEGRNFQFAHHLILFDLPLHPDLLEQRIGRLDRIGQRENIHIHIPYVENTPLDTMFHWYNDGLNAFKHPCPAGAMVYTKLEKELISCLLNGSNGTNTLIKNTSKMNHEFNEILQQGRDKLLEYNSSRPHIANMLLEKAIEEENNSNLPGFMEHIFDCYGVQIEEHTDTCYIIRPGENMLSPFPGLPDDGMTITYTRETALTNEDIHYLTWDHPMVNTGMDMVLSSELGNTALIAIKDAAIEPGTLFIETVYLLECSSSEELQANRYLPSTSLRILLDENNRQYNTCLDYEKIERIKIDIDKKTAIEVIKEKQTNLKKMLQETGKIAGERLPDLVDLAQNQASQTLNKETQRLNTLKSANPNIRAEEIHFFEKQLALIKNAMGSSKIRLEACRILVAT